MKLSETKNAICVTCSNKANARFGEANQFFGKAHSKKTKELITQKALGRIRTPEEIEQARIQLSKVANTKSVLVCWTEKYGEQEANIRWEAKKKKNSIASSGSNNPMFGKVSPQGSGNGWSGWYGEWYFRSLLELSYMVKVIERFNISWTTGDILKIPYKDYLNKQRNYFPDFILNNKYVIEIKPNRLKNTPSVIAKQQAAIAYCKANNMVYKLITPYILQEKEIINLYSKGNIKFLPRYEEKFKQRYLNGA